MRRFLLNKYALAFLLFAALLLFSKSNGIIRLMHQYSQIKELKEKKQYYEEKIKSTQKLIQSLEYDTAVLEKYAREKYFMKKDNEDVFVIIRDRKELKK